MFGCAGSSLHCACSLYIAAAIRGYCLAVVLGLLTAVAFLVLEHGP